MAADIANGQKITEPNFVNSIPTGNIENFNKNFSISNNTNTHANTLLYPLSVIDSNGNLVNTNQTFRSHNNSITPSG